MTAKQELAATTYQIINLETGEFQTVTVEEADEMAALDPAEIEWAIEEEGICKTDVHQITKLDDAPTTEGVAPNDAGDAHSGARGRVLTFISRGEFGRRLSANGGEC